MNRENSIFAGFRPAAGRGTYTSMNELERKQLQIAACKLRMGVIEATHGAKAGHPGGSLSAAELFTYLYFKEMNIDPANPKWEERDRFVLSKGHTAPGLYSALALRGFFPVEDLPTLRHIDSYLQGHPNMNTVPGVDMSTGSLGQGISCAAGMALGGKHRNKDYRVYTLLGDGELQLKHILVVGDALAGENALHAGEHARQEQALPPDGQSVHQSHAASVEQITPHRHRY